MGIRTKHFGASFEAGLEAGLEGLKAMEIGENNVTKKVPVLVLKTYEKAGAQKWASPVWPWMEKMVATPAKLTARAALRLQVCINAVAQRSSLTRSHWIQF